MTAGAGTGKREADTALTCATAAEFRFPLSAFRIGVRRLRGLRVERAVAVGSGLNGVPGLSAGRPAR